MRFCLWLGMVLFAADAGVEAVCSPCASHETGSVASDGEGVDYHQDELVSKFTSSVLVLHVMSMHMFG